MSAIVTDQFRILNATNFIDSVENQSNSFYVWVGLANPGIYTGFARDANWDGSETADPLNAVVPNPIDNLDYLTHYSDTILFGKKITGTNIRRVIKRVDWVRGKKYDMYRHDYSILNKSPIAQRARLYDSEYYVMNTDYKVYICIRNGSSGINSTGNQSLYEPDFTDLEPSVSGLGNDGYLWKYLFTVSPSDIVKFDSTEYITLPNNWNSSTDSQIVSVRENGDSSINNNQIKTVYIDNPGKNYQGGENNVKEVDILGDGTGGKVSITVNANGEIIETNVTSGGTGYTYGIVDLGTMQPSGNISNPAKLIPIIPPSKGHGYDLYKELGADKIMIYSRFDDSTRDFPINTKFCQIGILKNPEKYGSIGTFTDSQFSGLYAIQFSSVNQIAPQIGEKIIQNSTGAFGYIASYDTDTKVLKYFKDRSLYYGSSYDQTDYIGISSSKNANVNFINPQIPTSEDTIVGTNSGFNGTQISSLTGITTTINGSVINLGSSFTNGLANPEINKKTGDIIYIDNRPLVSRNIRQKEDIKIILEF
jgi:hypothetical protein